MMEIGITGNIGSGKSTISKAFETLGIGVYYADIRAAILMNQNEDIKQALINLFGEEIYNDIGFLNRQRFASIIFSDNVLRKKVNAIVHPAVAADFEEWNSYQESPYVLKEAALLFESGSHRDLDKIICVTAPLPLRIQRVLKRDKRGEEQIRAIEASQMSENEKIKLSHYIINNDETQPLVPQLLNIHKKILEIKPKTSI